MRNEETTNTVNRQEYYEILAYILDIDSWKADLIFFCTLLALNNYSDL